ncbi:alpha/beta hydrolase [Chelatococcus asaccharovorans]|uniref:Palmitoyl-protein thioesterase ABHD10, mitochondrial n=1 Tax=Chelatococcus asaccharovorans TaxID=28210 RepID=A0A2V3TZ52_9HYPH|nr:alpha/beta hydrolase [Chelatococcus asaccharovorans]MBS7704837.1 alpha/beta hydrolase [Chelatococcus asaccharovorans]PXW54734.1 alpha-beta hydrolase superfamily lysophospholipase [Chelatococcus asaccharovorans]
MGNTPDLQFLGVGDGERRRDIAVLSRPGAGPAVVWLGGFRSDMRATKATALDEWAAEAGRAFLRFDYSGHGESTGRFEDGTISRWLEESIAVITTHTDGAPVLVGSSMGGWLALLATLRLRAAGSPHAPSGLVLIAPAVDFTERLMWHAFPEEARRVILTDGVFMRPSQYGEPYAITRGLIEDGRRHLLLDGAIEPGCPVHILQGMEDPDVPWRHVLGFVEHLPGEAVTLTLIKDGDHRLSRPEDIERLVAAVAAMA